MVLIKKLAMTLFFILTVGLTWGRGEEEKTLLLNLGNPKLKNKTMDIFPETIYSAQTGRAVAFSQMIKEMQASRLVYIGETHDSLPMHNIQARIIQELFEQDRNLSIGMEMLNVGLQEIAHKWTLGILSEDEFIQQARWYVNWNFHFGYYRGIFSLAKEYHIPIYALNAPQNIITKIRMQGWEALSEEQKALVPQPDLSNHEHRILIHAIFEDMEMPPAMKGPGLNKVFEGLYRAQSAWDEVMAVNVLEFSRRDRNKMVVLAGSGHLLYNLGINRRAFEKSRWPFATVICVVIPAGSTSIPVSRALADYIWGLKAEDRPAFPAVGLRFKKFAGLENPVIERDPIKGAALEAGFAQGDIVLGVNGKKFSDINELRIFLAQFDWGDEVVFTVLRKARKKDIRLKFHKEK